MIKTSKIPEPIVFLAVVNFWEPRLALKSIDVYLTIEICSSNRVCLESICERIVIYHFGIHHILILTLSLNLSLSLYVSWLLKRHWFGFFKIAEVAECVIGL